MLSDSQTTATVPGDLRDEQGEWSSALVDFLISRGIPKHKQATEVGRILGVDRTTTHRKFKGDSPWKKDELKAIAARFGVTMQGLVSGRARSAPVIEDAEDAVVRIPGLPSTGKLVVGQALDEDDVCDLVAVRMGDVWEVYLGAQCPSGGMRHMVQLLTLTATKRPRIALVEDDCNTAAVLAEVLEAAGMVAYKFATIDELLGALASGHRYDTYVLDWNLGTKTAEPAIEAIRAIDESIPILITTGEIRKHDDLEDVVMRVCDQWNAAVLEKPFRNSVLISNIRRDLAR